MANLDLRAARVQAIETSRLRAEVDSELAEARQRVVHAETNISDLLNTNTSLEAELRNANKKIALLVKSAEAKKAPKTKVEKPSNEA